MRLAHSRTPVHHGIWSTRLWRNSLVEVKSLALKISSCTRIHLAVIACLRLISTLLQIAQFCCTPDIHLQLCRLCFWRIASCKICSLHSCPHALNAKLFQHSDGHVGPEHLPCRGKPRLVRSLTSLVSANARLQLACPTLQMFIKQTGTFYCQDVEQRSCQSATGSVVAGLNRCCFTVSLQQLIQAAGRRFHVRKATEVKSEEAATEDPAEQGLPKGEEYEVRYRFCHHFYQILCW